ncbi:MAG: FliM/FliN family flagellar motor switch protein [Ardenticatenales bacterium]
MSSSLSSSSSSDTAASRAADLDWVMDVPCPVDFVLGTTTIKVRECAAFAVNAIVRLKQTAGADLEVRVAGVAIATGEVVIADENVALRVGRILPPAGQEIV